MNHVSQGAFEAVQPGNVVTQFLPNKPKFNTTPTQKWQPVRNAFLLGGLPYHRKLTLHEIKELGINAT